MNALVVDLGNTHWKAAHVGAQGLTGVLSGPYDDLDRLREVIVVGGGNGVRALVASVAPEHRYSWFMQLAQAAGLRVERIDGGRPLGGVRPGYRKPEQLGVDRLLAMVAVRAMTQSPFCVIDAGTAVTLDFVDAGGQHLGGLILPGQRLAREALLANTAIPRDDSVEVGDRLGLDTPTGIALGGRYAVAAIAEMFLTGSRALFTGQSAAVFVGGGDADAVASALSLPCTKIENLVLRGLAELVYHGEG